MSIKPQWQNQIARLQDFALRLHQSAAFAEPNGHGVVLEVGLANCPFQSATKTACRGALNSHAVSLPTHTLLKAEITAKCIRKLTLDHRTKPAANWLHQNWSHKRLLHGSDDLGCNDDKRSVGYKIASPTKNMIHRCSMYGIFTYIYHKFKPNVGKCSICGASGIVVCRSCERQSLYIYLEPKWHLFWLEFRPSFGGLTFKNRGHGWAWKWNLFVLYLRVRTFWTLQKKTRTPFKTAGSSVIKGFPVYLISYWVLRYHLVGGWTNPSEKILVKMGIFPKVRGVIKKIFKTI